MAPYLHHRRSLHDFIKKRRADRDQSQERHPDLPRFQIGRRHVLFRQPRGRLLQTVDEMDFQSLSRRRHAVAAEAAQFEVPRTRRVIPKRCLLLPCSYFGMVVAENFRTRNWRRSGRTDAAVTSSENAN